MVTACPLSVYPAEIRAPKGTVAGVSGFQVHIGNHKVNTPGDFCDMLVAMNPAALKANAKWLKCNALVLVNENAFDDLGMKKAGFTGNPFEELHIEDRTITCSPITKLTEDSLKDSGLDVSVRSTSARICSRSEWPASFMSVLWNSSTTI